MRAHEYNADVWAYVVGELGRRIQATHGQRPVVGAIEGTHADVAPAIRPGSAGHIEAARVGRLIGVEAAALFDRLGSQLRSDVTLGAGLREVDLDRSATIDGISLPRRPAVGAALVAGAHENVTPVIHRLPPFRAGRPKRRGIKGPHGPKWVLGSRWLQPLILPLGGFPRVLPVQVLTIGPTTVVGLPFEITVEAGRRIADAVGGVIGRPGDVIVSSVTNEYAGYLTTAEEYELQHYEGGHTLYGSQTQRFFAAHAARLAAEVGQGGPGGPVGIVSDVAAERRWKLRLHRYLAPPTRLRTRRIALDCARFTDPTRSEDGHWSFDWRDVDPGDLAWHEPMVRIEASDDDGSTWRPAADDQGWAVDVRHLGTDDVGHRYRTRWFNPDHRAGRRHRFVVLANAGQPVLYSDPFD